ncbi:MAG TPA: STAS domain-containing protein [Acidiferrobacterales bacterium]
MHAPTGALSFDSVTALLAGSRGWFAPGADVVIDLAGVTQADSAGVALMVEWLRLARRAGGRAEFRNVPAQVRNLIAVSGLGEALLGAAPGRA